MTDTTTENPALPYQDYNPTVRRLEARTPLFERFIGWLTAQPYVLGCDLSHWNATVDFKRIYEGGYRFVILKATEQVHYTDPTFSTRWRQALDAGLYVGPYHFFRMNYDGTAQADHHLEIVRPLWEATKGVWIPPCNDVETEDGTSISYRINRVKQWDSFVRTEIKRDPLVYTSQYLWQLLVNNLGLSAVTFAAHWTSASTPLWPYNLPAALRLFWQFGVYPKHAWAPAVPGVTGEVDVVRFLGTIEDLKTFVGVKPGPTLDEKVDKLWAAHPELWP